MPDEDRLLVIVEDDDRFAATLTRSFERRGYTVVSLAGLAPLEALLAERTPT
ncbi:two-component system response regulator, partial [Methylobacterium frigidaeris]